MVSTTSFQMRWHAWLVRMVAWAIIAGIAQPARGRHQGLRAGMGSGAGRRHAVALNKGLVAILLAVGISYACQQAALAAPGDVPKVAAVPTKVSKEALEQVLKELGLKDWEIFDHSTADTKGFTAEPPARQRVKQGVQLVLEKHPRFDGPHKEPHVELRYVGGKDAKVTWVQNETINLQDERVPLRVRQSIGLGGLFILGIGLEARQFLNERADEIDWKTRVYYGQPTAWYERTNALAPHINRQLDDYRRKWAVQPDMLDRAFGDVTPMINDQKRHILRGVAGTYGGRRDEPSQSVQALFRITTGLDISQDRPRGSPPFEEGPAIRPYLPTPDSAPPISWMLTDPPPALKHLLEDYNKLFGGTPPVSVPLSGFDPSKPYSFPSHLWKPMSVPRPRSISDYDPSLPFGFHPPTREEIRRQKFLRELNTLRRLEDIPLDNN